MVSTLDLTGVERIAIISPVMLLSTIVHTLDPVALSIGPLSVKWYGVSYALGFLGGWAILRQLTTTGRFLMQPPQVGDLLTWLVGGVIVGGRVGHVAFYEPSLFLKWTSTLPFWGLLEIHKGGMSSHGGMIGVFLAALLWAKSQKLPAAHIFDMAAFGAPVGLMFGRLANWVNGELWGKPVALVAGQPAPWWTVAYPEEVFAPNFDATTLQGLGATLGNPQSPANAVYAACYSGRPEIVAQLEPLLTPRWPVNFLQAFTDGPILALVLILVWWRPRKSGTVTGAFLITYGCTRLVTEQVRMGDNTSWDLGGFTAPMQLSALMIMLGMIVIVAATRSKQPRVGGIAAC